MRAKPAAQRDALVCESTAAQQLLEHRRAQHAGTAHHKHSPCRAWRTRRIAACGAQGLVHPVHRASIGAMHRT
jgi:hypothetical protein